MENVMNEYDFEWFLKNQAAYDSLTTDQLHVLGQGGVIAYDPDAEPAAAVAPVVEVEVAAAVEPEDNEPKVMAKDGKNFIPFSELEAARDRASQLETIAKEQSTLIESLKAAKATDAGTGDTEAQDDLLKEFKEQYPDMAALLTPAIQKMIDAGVDVRTAEMKKQFTDALAPIQQSTQDTQVDKHFEAITGAVPDFEALRDSGDVEKWIDTQPSYVKAAATRVLNEGTAAEVIELFKSYKDAQPVAVGVGKQALSKDEASTKAAEAIAKAKGGKMVSLSDIPAGSQHAEDGQPTTTQGWSEKFSRMSPEEIMKQL
jgi:hypothetical protein